MRIYYQMGENLIGSDELGEIISRQADNVHMIMLEKLKYQIMWALRSLEDEINNSGGCIIINSENLSSKTTVECKGFENGLIEKINAIAKDIKF